MEKLHSLINEVLEITYGKYGAQWRKDLYKNDKIKYYTLLSEGNWYEQIHNAELEGERLIKRKCEEKRNSSLCDNYYLCYFDDQEKSV